MQMLRIPIWLTACALVIMVVRQNRPEFAVAATIVAGVIAFFMMKEELGGFVQWIDEMGRVTAAPDGITETMLKAGGIALICEFASDMCSDAGEKAIAGRIDMAERVLLATLCLPVASRLLEEMLRILS